LPYGETWYETAPLDKWKFTTYERDSETGRSTWRFLLYVGIASFGTIILVMFYAAFSKPIAPPRIDGG